MQRRESREDLKNTIGRWIAYLFLGAAALSWLISLGLLGWIFIVSLGSSGPLQINDTMRRALTISLILSAPLLIWVIIGNLRGAFPSKDR